MVTRVTRGRLVLGMASALAAGSASGESLMEVYELARENDPQFQEDFFNRQATDERYYQARSALLPQISANVSLSEVSQDIKRSDNEVFGSGGSDYSTQVYGVSLTQSLYDYSRWAALGQARLEIQQAAAELEVARQDLLLRVAERYFDALALYETLGYLQAEKSAIRTNLDMTRARYQDGLAREIDLLDAEARFLQVEARELDVENRLQDALNGLAEVTGGLPTSLQVLDPGIGLSRPSPDSREEWTRLAVEQSPRLMAVGLSVDAASQETRVRRGGHFPTLDLSLNYNNDDTDGSLYGGGSEVETQTVRVGLEVPIYRGGLVSSQVRESEQRLSAQQAMRDRILRETDRRVQSSFQGILTAMAREEALSESLRASERIAESRQLGFDSGVTPMLDLLDAQRDLFLARSELANARYHYLVSVVQLKHAAGILTAEDLREIDTFLGDSVNVSSLRG